MQRRTRARVVAIFMVGVFALTLVGGVLSATLGTDGGGDTTEDTLDLADLEPAPQVSDLPPVTIGELPPEAIDTLNLIADDGPFPFDRDGLVFQNREGLLPPNPDGYYREYTVVTPGEDDRGPRRLVVGEQLEVYYTEDHYESFRELVLG